MAYRHQPLFSYRFKDAIGPESSHEEVLQFLQQLYACSDDEFLADRWADGRQLPFEFEKSPEPWMMVMKMVRYHHLIPMLLDHPSAIRVVGIVRHPCGVIHSWANAPREFDASWSIQDQWQFAQGKNEGRGEEFFGVEKWLEVAEMFMDLESRNDRFLLLRYEDLVSNAPGQVARVLEFCGLDDHPQIHRFIAATQRRHEQDAYAISKHPDVASHWQTHMDEQLINAILERVRRSVAGRRFT